MQLWWPKLRTGGMMAGDDFADVHDSLTRYDIHTNVGWGVKSAVDRFSREFGSPFFLTYADRPHTTTGWGSEREWGEDSPAERKRLTRDRRASWVRGHSFYPAWYLFK